MKTKSLGIVLAAPLHVGATLAGTYAAPPHAPLLRTKEKSTPRCRNHGVLLTAIFNAGVFIKRQAHAESIVRCKYPHSNAEDVYWSDFAHGRLKLHGDTCGRPFLMNLADFKLNAGCSLLMGDAAESNLADRAKVRGLWAGGPILPSESRLLINSYSFYEPRRITRQARRCSTLKTSFRAFFSGRNLTPQSNPAEENAICG
jgi:hypothetical protein